MKITSVKSHVLRYELEKELGYSQQYYKFRTAHLVEVQTDEGITGWGECFGPGNIALANKFIVEEVIQPLIIGEDPLNKEHIWHKVYNLLRDSGQKGMPIQALSGIDSALWDILGKKGSEKPCVLDKEGKIRDISTHVGDLNPDHMNFETISKLESVDLSSLPELSSSERIGSCVTKPGKFVAIGLNYSDHAAETGAEVPSEPIMFMKATSCIVGPNDDVEIVSGSKKLDWEVELGIVIGKETKHISEDKAQDHILGYCLVNDVSEREWQIEKMGQWVKGKSHDTYGPIGPYLVTKDEIADINNLKMSLDVNGNRMQTGNTSTMIFNVNVIVSYVSKFMSLQPGDIITTGTPPGVGMGMKPQQFLKAGDTMKLSIENLGEQNSKVVAL